MIAHVSGSITSTGADFIVVDVGGLGLRINCPPSLSAGHYVGESILVHTVLIVREDSLATYGFSSAEERDVFTTLLGVSGVGPRIALAAVSTLGVSGLVSALTTQSATSLQKVPGIGARSAQRILVDLDGKLAQFAPSADSAPGAGPASAWQADVASALESLGWNAKESARAVEFLAADPSIPTDWDTASALRKALQYLAGTS